MFLEERRTKADFLLQASSSLTASTLSPPLSLRVCCFPAPFGFLEEEDEEEDLLGDEMGLDPGKRPHMAWLDAGIMQEQEHEAERTTDLQFFFSGDEYKNDPRNPALKNAPKGH